MFEDEAGFGRISKPRYCWCKKRIRPRVPCHHIREYRYVYGAVEPQTGESFFLVLPYCNTDGMNVYLRKLSKAYLDDLLLIVVDGAGWHRSKDLEIPSNIELIPLPPYTPELNPIEQIWREIRTSFGNQLFSSLEHVIDHLCDSICSLSPQTIRNITHRDWLPGHS